MSSLVIEITVQVLTAVAVFVILSSKRHYKNSKIAQQIVNLILSVNGLVLAVYADIFSIINEELAVVKMH